MAQPGKSATGILPQTIYRSVSEIFGDFTVRDVTSGSTVLSELTSRPPSHHAHRWDERVLRRLLGKRLLFSTPPTVVLDPSPTCWAFQGSTGHIALQLANPVHLHSLGISHLAQSQDPSSAPRHFRVWALMPHLSMEKIAKQLPTEQMVQPPDIFRASGTFSAILLAQFEFEIQVDQRFVVQAPFNDATFKVDKLLVQITSNWGGDHTCLYELHVFGV